MLCAVPIVVCAKPGLPAGFITVCHTLLSCVPNVTSIISYCVPNNIVLCANNHFGIYHTIVLCYIFKCSVFFLRNPYFYRVPVKSYWVPKTLGILGHNLCHVPVKTSWVPKTLGILGHNLCHVPVKTSWVPKTLSLLGPNLWHVPVKSYWVPKTLR